MHAIKGGWVGQTFALAKNNDYEGRKSRIRRSKEERKEMVESFIKKYQNLHNGSFPSLNLTHKEVGGSFYTVREIVRDVIQENRVLGPAKFTSEGQTMDQVFEHNPLGSVAAEPLNSLSLASSDPQFAKYQGQGTVQDMVFSSDGKSFTLEHNIFDQNGVIIGTAVGNEELQVNGRVATEKNVAEESEVSNGDCIVPGYHMFDNGNQVNQQDREIDKVECAEHKTSEPLEVEKKVEEVLATSKSKVTSIEFDVVVETFPLKPVMRTTKSLDGMVEVTDLNISPEDKGTEGMKLATDVLPLDSTHCMKNMVDDKAALTSQLVENKSSTVNEEALQIARDPSLESSEISNLDESIMHEKCNRDLNVKAPGNDVQISESFEPSQGTAGAKTMKAPDTKNLNGTSVGKGLSQTKNVLEIEDEAAIPSSAGLQNGNTPTLDRINLESWQRPSKKSGKREGKPLWDVFKEYINAFVKFWSE